MSLRVEQDGRLCRITLASAETRNVLDGAACRNLLAEITAAESDNSTGAILIDADGPVFCAGAEPDEELLSVGRRVMKPIIAAVQGVALSEGVALIANAHVAVAAQGTSFGLTAIRDGRWPEPFSRGRLRHRRTPSARAGIDRPRLRHPGSARLGFDSPGRPGHRTG